MSITATAQYISNVVASISHVHIEHLHTYDYAKHKTLDEYYKEMPDLIDELAETFLGTNGKLKKLPNPTYVCKGIDVNLPELMAEGEKLVKTIPTTAIRVPMENVLSFMAHIAYKLKIK